jgi:hypothetical protein
LKEELLEDVVARIKGCERDLEVIAVSESEEEAEDLGGDNSSIATETRSYGFRVRRIGPLLSILPFDCASSLVFLGSVRAQFSHGIALFLSFSSYVFRKLESRL